jgi:S-(hydroxymethyl)glutathione dehydrogenase/alcohol dehydrogenase
VCREFGKPLIIEDLDIRAPQFGEIRVRLAACAICHSDIHYMEGAWGGELPAVYGHEASGVVDGIGPGVKLIRPGDHVVVALIRSCGHCYFCARGEPNMCETRFPLDERTPLSDRNGAPVVHGLRTAAFAEFVVVDQSQVVKIPDTMPMDSASMLACGVITGLGAVVNTAKVPAGSSVVVIGTGGVGLNSVQGARLSGAHPVIAVDVADTKLDAAARFGATHTINSSRQDLAAVVRSLTAGRGADYAFVTVGSVPAITASVGLLRRSGTCVVVGMPAVGVKMNFEALDFADRGQTIIGSKMGSARLQIDVPKLVELYENKRLRLDELVTERYPLDEINEAVAKVNSGSALRNVIMF